jgi:hypothetical protein
MKKLIKKILQKSVFGNYLLNIYAKYYLNRLARSYKDPKDFFAYIYESNLWGSEESLSGPGSTAEYTKNLRKELPVLFSEYQINSVLDAPCGDFNWFRYLKKEVAIDYIGGDIVQKLVDTNNSLYSNSNTRFIYLDITGQKLPKSDIWFCRDVLFHFSNHDIVLAIKNFIDSEIPFLLTSNYPYDVSQKNVDIPTGSFRLLNLQIPPFNFPTPLKEIDDSSEGYPKRKMCLWDRDQLSELSKFNPIFRI